MFLLMWLVLCLVAASIMLLPLVLWRREIRRRYSGSRLVTCPENQQSGVVCIDARHAVDTGIDGCPDLRLSGCTRWPERANCDQGCLSQAVQAGPDTPGEVKVGTKQIYHLPVILAAFAAWYLGAVWHSRFLFRTQWLDAIGLNHAEVRQVVGLYLLLSLAVCLLFAYGVAWLLAVWHRKGVLQGVLMSALLCGAVVAMGWYGLARLPHDFLAIETGYAVLATLAVGAIVGGFYDKLVMPPQDRRLRT
jgi:Protein of unknown function (DUF1761)